MQVIDRSPFLCTGRGPIIGAAQEPVKEARPNVEVVFCLDTTGSMGGLINAAKQKIWAISNQIAAGKPTPRLKIGLVAYRDRGDAYVTQVTDLTDDLDAIHGKVMSFRPRAAAISPNRSTRPSSTPSTRSTGATTRRP